MAKLLKEIFFIFCIHFIVEAQVLLPGKCPMVKPKSSFNPIKFLGKWYVIEHFKTHIGENGTCLTVDYDAQPHGKILATYSGIDVERLNTFKYFGFIEFDEGSLSKMLIQFINDDALKELVPYWVIDCDYNSFAIVWTCFQVNESQHIEMSWVLGRLPTLSDDKQKNIHKTMTEFGINSAKYTQVDHSDC